MATAELTTQNSSEKASPTLENGAVDVLAESLAKADLQETEQDTTPPVKKAETPPRALHVYTRPQVLFLYKSPLVKTPEGMPPLRDWFGDWNEQVASKKDSEASGTSANTRDRRFRRDPEDGETPARPSFRSTLSQPSQMGNFRHQSLRTNDRDRDVDKERERDIRDKEGQERLRNLSDKYDRERLALTSAASALRGKERDSAPHLASGASSRLGQTQGSNATRRAEGREAGKRKPGESSEDWRRGAEPARAGRDDRSDISRRDRDNRERPRSRVRDTSRTRREPSTRRDRDREERDRDRERGRDRRGDDKDEPPRREDYGRRDREDYPRRDWDDHYARDRDDFYRGDRDRFDHGRTPRDPERDLEDDPRRWRDDGKRDERLAGRRGGGWDRWEPSHDRDRNEDRDGRSKRGPARDKKGLEDTKEGRDREDRKEREKEKEPAWMETYIPPATSGGILGGQNDDGELDGIQAWKKGMKEKERKEKGGDVSPGPGQKAGTEQPPDSALPLGGSPSAATSDNQMDEIQLFKLMMKREADKKGSEPTSNGNLASAASAPQRLENGSPSTSKDLAKASGPSDMELASKEAPLTSDSTAPVPPVSTSAMSNGPQSLLSLIASTSVESVLPPPHAVKPSASLDVNPDKPPPAVSRMFPNPPPISTSVSQASDRPTVDLSIPAGSSSTTPFNPPPGSRLLAFASRTPSGASATSGPASQKPFTSADPSTGAFSGPIPPGLSVSNAQKRPGNTSPSTIMNMNMGMYQTPDPLSNISPDTQFGQSRATPSDSNRSARSYSPFAHPSQPSYPYDEDASRLAEHLRRASTASTSDRAAFGQLGEASSPYSELGATSNFPANGLAPFDLGGGNIVGAHYATGKGSRLAKMLDAKSREAQVATGMRKAQGPPGLVSTSPHPDQRQDLSSINGMVGNAPDNRAMDDLFAMLQNSAQSHRASPQIGQTGRIPSGGGSYEFRLLQQQQQQQQHQQQQQQQQQLQRQQQFLLQQTNRLDSLYDSRLDDRSFVPDGMVPGLRPAHTQRPRSREPSGVLFNEQIDDPLHFNHRIPQQPRNLEQMYSGHMTSAYNQQQAGMVRNGGMPLQQQTQFRGGPSPISSQNPLQDPSRLPPGLANLGGRPPHDPSQYVGSPMGIPGVGGVGGLHGGLHNNAPAPQAFNNFGGGGLGFNGNPQVRGPIPGSHHQSPLNVNPMAGLGPANSMDMRGPSQAQLLAMGAGSLGGSAMGGGGMRGTGGAGFNPGHGPQMQIPPMVLRQQQQQQQQQGHIPPHMLPHLIPPHLQQQQGIPGGNNQGAQDLMALLMGGQRD